MKITNSHYKNIILGTAAFFLFVITIISIQFFKQTTGSPLTLDFLTWSSELGAYGTLVSGILAFLSVLFVLYNVYESRAQIEKQRQEKIEEDRESNLNKLKLISNILISTTDEIIGQGKAMKTYYEGEIGTPSKMNVMIWNSNRHFGRLMNMDFGQMFVAFQTHFKHDLDWNKTLLNLYNLNDFYGDAFADLKQKYRDHIHWKVAEQKKIGYDLEQLVGDGVDTVELYREENGVDNYMDFAWSNLFNDFVVAYHAYLQETADAGEVPDYRHISNEIMLPLIKHGMEIRKEQGFDKLGSKAIINNAAKIRKKINEVEVYSVQYGEDIKKQYETYFKEDCDSVIHYKKIKEKIDIAIEKA